jgi:Zn-dependent protease
MDIHEIVRALAVYALPVLFAITLHEAAHGYVARHFGDMTAFAQGRISLNPARHIDLLGTIVIPLAILAVTGGRFLFGWAKPVPVNYSALRRPKQQMLWVAAAGPASNLAMALGWAILFRLGVAFGSGGAIWERLAAQRGTGAVVEAIIRNGFSASDFLVGIGAAGIVVNLVFMLLNLLPILPLDGGRIVASLLPGRAAWQFSKLEPWGLPILLLLLVTNVLGFVIGPLLVESEAILRKVVLL